MKRKHGHPGIAVAALVIGALLLLATWAGLGGTLADAGATTNPRAKVTLACVGKHVRATFTYSGFSPKNHLTATQTLHINGSPVTNTVRFDGPGATLRMVVRLPSRRVVKIHAVTTVRGGAGRVKATAQAKITCRKPPPPPDKVRPTAHFQGPCGDPFYRAVLNNKRSDRAVTFRVSYKPFGDPRREIVRRVGAHKRVITHWFDVAGRTRMTIRAGGKVLVTKRSAPNRIYRPCW